MRDMVRALKAAEVDFLVVGAFAVAAHGVPRATKRASGRPKDLVDVAVLEARLPS
jgi:hypothetical protein